MVNCFEALAKRFLALEIRFFSKIGFLKPRVEEVSRLEIRFFSKIGFLKPRVEEVFSLRNPIFFKDFLNLVCSEFCKSLLGL